MGPKGKLTIIIQLSGHNSSTSFRLNKSMAIRECRRVMIYLICPRTRGLFFVLLMFESNGTSKNYEKRRQQVLNIIRTSSALVLKRFHSKLRPLPFFVGDGDAAGDQTLDLPPTSHFNLDNMNFIIS